jgi:hypothetical protein
MKTSFIFIVAAFLGAFIGCILVGELRTVDAAGAAKLTVRELVIVDENNRPSASLTSVKGRTVLTFFAPTGKRQVELGFDAVRDLRFLNLLERTGTRSNAALTSGPPHSEGSLSLGDDFWEGKVVLGALRGDVVEPADGPDTEDWGLAFHRYNESDPTVSILAPPKASSSRAEIRIRTATGAPWIAP